MTDSKIVNELNQIIKTEQYRLFEFLDRINEGQINYLIEETKDEIKFINGISKLNPIKDNIWQDIVI